MTELFCRPGSEVSDQDEGRIETRRPWRAPRVIVPEVLTETHKTSDTLGEGHATGTTLIS
jgi:hypothetical protein